MKTPKENNKAATVDDLQEALKNNGAGALITEAELGELLRKNGAPTDEEIASRLEELRTIKHTPEEIREKERLEAIITDAEARLSEITKKMSEIKKKYTTYYTGIPAEALEKYNSLKAEKNNTERNIEGYADEIRRISAGQFINRQRLNEYMNAYGTTHNEAAALKKSMEINEAAGDLTGYENMRKLYFEKKAELRKLKENEPERVQEIPTGRQELYNFQKSVRKNALTKILYYSEQIEKTLSTAEQIELGAVGIVEGVSWEHYRQTRPAGFTGQNMTRAFYAGPKNHYNTSGIKSMLQEMK